MTGAAGDIGQPPGRVARELTSVVEPAGGKDR